jgi:hypothetical protein
MILFPTMSILFKIKFHTKEAIGRCFNAAGFQIKRKQKIGTLSAPKSSNFNEEAIISDLLAKIQPKEHFYIDIGAGDGESMSNSFPLVNAGWKGLAVEGGGMPFAKLAHRYAEFPRVHLAREWVTPDSVLNLLAGYGTPKEFGFLSLDIDGYDYFVLDKILSAYRPSLICTEINERIPPPLQFTVKYSPDLEWQGGPFYSQSISILEELAKKYKYSLVKLEYNNAFLIPSEISPLPAITAEEAYKIGYVDKPNRLVFMPANKEFDPAITMSKDQAVAFFKEKFKAYDGKYILR